MGADKYQVLPIDFAVMTPEELLRTRTEVEGLKRALELELSGIRRDGARFGKYVEVSVLSAIERAIVAHKNNLSALNSEQAARRALRQEAARSGRNETEHLMFVIEKLNLENESLKAAAVETSQAVGFMRAARIVLGENTFQRILGRSQDYIK